MKASCDETLNRLVRRLSTEYDINCPHEAPHLGFPSLPLHLGPEICSFPCLSIATPPNNNERQQKPYADASTKLDQSQHQDFIHLMARKVSYRQHSIPFASYSLLRSLVLTFGRLLELQIQRMIYNVMESKNKSKCNSVEDEEILKKFTDLPTSFNGNLVIPELAWTNFSTMLPMEHWQEVGYDNVSLRLVFQAEITLRVIPNDTVYTAFLKAPGFAIGGFANPRPNPMNRPESLEIDIDTKALYNSIRKECKLISKKVVNAIVGFELVKPRHKNSSKRRINPHNHPNVGVDMNMSAKPYSVMSDGGTFKTEKTTISSVDGRDLRSTTSLSHDDYNQIQALISDKDLHGIVPKKRHATHPGDTKSIGSSSADITSVFNEEDQTKAFANISIIYEESMEEMSDKKSKKKKGSSWKRLLSSPHHKKGDDINRHLSNEIRSDESSIEKKIKKQNNTSWKGLFMYKQ